ncbi:hypothetical protein DSECCO2_649470 [anaerobic digester metagenome]
MRQGPAAGGRGGRQGRAAAVGPADWGSRATARRRREGCRVCCACEEVKPPVGEKSSTARLRMRCRQSRTGRPAPAAAGRRTTTRLPAGVRPHSPHADSAACATVAKGVRKSRLLALGRSAVRVSLARVRLRPAAPRARCGSAWRRPRQPRSGARPGRTSRPPAAHGPPAC